MMEEDAVRNVDMIYVKKENNIEEINRINSIISEVNIMNPDSCRCEGIYESERIKKLEGKKRTMCLIFLSCFLALCAIVSTTLLQYDEYFAYINDRNDYIASSKEFCHKILFYNIDLVSTPIAGFLIIIYILLYKRRVLWVNKIKYRNVGMPMMVSLWSKNDRRFSAFTYGLIAFNIYTVVRNSLRGSASAHLITSFKDPSGILALLLKVVDMILIGVRYYPVLVAYRVNSFFVTSTTAIYMW